MPAWEPTRSHLNQLGASPKHHLVDPTLAVVLLGLDEAALLRGEDVPEQVRDGPFLGALFESLVTLGVRAVIVTTGEYAYRRSDGIAVVPAALFGP